MNNLCITTVYVVGLLWIGRSFFHKYLLLFLCAPTIQYLAGYSGDYVGTCRCVFIPSVVGYSDLVHIHNSYCVKISNF